MAINLISLPTSPFSLPHSHLHLHLQPKPIIRFPPSISSARSFGPPRNSRTKRGEAAVVRAGPPSSSSLIIAFVLPLSLLAGTIFTSIRIADQLDEQFFEELAMNKAVMEEEEEEEEEGEAAVAVDGDGNVILEEEKEEIGVGVPRVRNRPRREA